MHGVIRMHYDYLRFHGMIYLHNIILLSMITLTMLQFSRVAI